MKITVHKFILTSITILVMNIVSSAEAPKQCVEQVWNENQILCGKDDTHFADFTTECRVMPGHYTYEPVECEKGTLEGSFPPGYVGVPYTGSFTIVGSTSSNNSVTGYGGVTGLSWSGGILSGIPTAATDTTVSAIANISGNTVTGDSLLTIYDRVQITEVAGKPLTDTGIVEFVQISENWGGTTIMYPTRTLANITLSAKGGPGSLIRYELIDRGTLPFGFTLSRDGVGSVPLGPPDDNSFEKGEYTFTVRAYDENVSPPNQGSEDIRKITVIVYDYVYTQHSAWNVLNSYHGAKIDMIIYDTKGGKPPYKFNVIEGSMPTGVELDTNTGRIYGTIMTPRGTSGRFTLEVTDSMGVKGARNSGYTLSR